VVLLARGGFLWIVASIFSLYGCGASAQTCLTDAPRYRLTTDAVTWAMTLAVGRSCLRGVRFGNVEFEQLKLISPPQSGVVELQGSGFIYSPAAHFSGKDSFSLAVLGAISGRRGSSTINVIVTVVSNDTRDAYSPAVTRGAAGGDHSTSSKDNSPPVVSIVTPAEATIISGSNVTLVADASDNVAVANVQFIVAGKNAGSVVTSPPYATVWDSTTVPDGSYTLYAVAQDTSGNYNTSSVRISVRNK
jgi:hypothetical protein